MLQGLEFGHLRILDLAAFHFYTEMAGHRPPYSIKVTKTVLMPSLMRSR